MLPVAIQASERHSFSREASFGKAILRITTNRLPFIYVSMSLQFRLQGVIYVLGFGSFHPHFFLFYWFGLTAWLLRCGLRPFSSRSLTLFNFFVLFSEQQWSS
ncbi:hypothetical protein AMECASPLE_000481 [Ameca splendens]|uniref:Uncharacterized protein n=1 Tax=Ameca splendens TaxID=208324 RepID=A0ABV0XB06_9TELE